MDSTPLLLKPPEAAAALGVCLRTLRIMTAKGAIPHVRVGRLVRSFPNDVRRVNEEKSGSVKRSYTRCSSPWPWTVCGPLDDYRPICANRSTFTEALSLHAQGKPCTRRS